MLKYCSNSRKGLVAFLVLLVALGTVHTGQAAHSLGFSSSLQMFEVMTRSRAIEGHRFGFDETHELLGPSPEALALEFGLIELSPEPLGHPPQDKKRAKSLGAQKGALHGMTEGIRRGTEKGAELAEARAQTEARAVALKAAADELFDEMVARLAARLQSDQTLLQGVKALASIPQGSLTARAYQVGKRDGASYANKVNGMLAGLQSGRADADRIMRSRARQMVKDDGLGVQRADNEFNDETKLRDLTGERLFGRKKKRAVVRLPVPQPNLVLASFQDPQVDWTSSPYYKPRHGFKDQELEDAYRQAYDHHFKMAAANSYRDAKKIAEQEIYRSALYWSSIEYKRKNKTTLKKETQKIIRDSYLAGYQAEKERVYNEDFRKGRQKALTAAEKTNFERILEEEITRSYRARVSELAKQGPKYRVRRVRLLDSNGDGIFMPGEKYTVELLVDNYGHADGKHKDLALILNTQSGPLQVGAGHLDLRPLAARTINKVSFDQAVWSAPRVAQDTPFELNARVRHQRKELHQQTLTERLKYPFLIRPSDRMRRAATAGRPIRAALTVERTVRKGPNNVQVRLSSPDPEIQIAQGEFDLNFSHFPDGRGAFTYEISQTSKDLYHLEIEVLDGNGKLLGFFRQPILTGVGWNPQPDAKALVVLSASRDSKRAEMAARVAGITIDIWNTNVDGPISMTVLDSYVGRAVAAGSDWGTFLESTRNRLRRFAGGQGWLYYWGQAPRLDSRVSQYKKNYALGGGLTQLTTNSFEPYARDRLNILLHASRPTALQFGTALQTAALAAMALDAQLDLLVQKSEWLRANPGAKARTEAALIVTTLQALILRRLAHEMKSAKDYDHQAYSPSSTRYSGLALLAYVGKAKTFSRSELRHLRRLHSELVREATALASPVEKPIKTILRQLDRLF